VDDTGKTIATWKAAKESQTFDTKRFSIEHPEEYAEYVVTKAGSRRFLLK